MSLHLARNYGLSGNFIPNTFIGGIAKQGGTGVNAPIDTPYKLSQKLGIAVNRISGFKVVGDDVECRIKGSYKLKRFGSFTDPSQRNLNITKYIDVDGLVYSAEADTFVYCPEFEELVLNSLSSIDNPGRLAVGCAKLKKAHINSMPVLSLSVNAGFFDGCTILGDVSYSSAITYEGYFLHRNNTQLIRVDLSNLTYFRGSASGGSYINNAFQGMSSVEEIDLRKLESFHRVGGVDDHADRSFKIFQGIKTGCVIKVRDVLATLNAGSPPPDLLYAKNMRLAIVELYDDNGNYVTTL